MMKTHGPERKQKRKEVITAREKVSPFTFKFIIISNTILIFFPSKLEVDGRSRPEHQLMGQREVEC